MFGFQQNQTSLLFNTNKGVNYDDNLGCGFSKQANLNGIVSDGLIFLVDASKQDFIQKKNNRLPDLVFQNNAQLNQGSYIQDYYSGSIVFDGIDDNVVIPNSNNFPINKGTWSIWCYYSVDKTDKMCLIQRHSAQSASGIIITVYSISQNLIVQIYSASVAIAVLGLSSGANKLLRNQWNNISFTFNDNKTARLYINGNLITSGIPSGTWSFNNQNITLGTSPDAYWNKFNGKVSNVAIYNRELTASEIMQNYNALLKRFSKITEFDIDIINFIKIANLTTTNEQLAISNLVTDLKFNNLWDKLLAIYPFVGNTSSQFKWNLKDLRDSNDAFRLNFVGTWTFSSTGAKSNLIDTTYIDTFFIPSANFSNTLMSLSYYSRTSDKSATVDFGPSKWADTFTYGFLRTNTDKTQFRLNSTDTEAAVTNLDGKGFYTFNRTSTSTIKFIKNSTINTVTQNSDYILPHKILLNGRATDAAGTLFSSGIREIAFASIGKTLTDSEATTFYNIVQAYQTTLGRQV